MRSKRMRTYRKKFRHVILFGKVVLIWYLLVFSVSYITTSDTAADFTDLREAKSMIYAAGDWKVVDESAFKFIKNDNAKLNTCEPGEIKAKLENSGKEDMQDTSTYDVYFSKSGDPETDGEKVELAEDEGTIPALERDKSSKLTFKASQPGHYKFVAYQLDEDETEVWSDEFTVSCESEQKQDANEQDDSKPDNNEQSKDTTDNQDKEVTSDDDDTNDSKDNNVKENDDVDATEDSQVDQDDHAGSPEEDSADEKVSTSSDTSSEAAENDTEKGELKDEKDEEQ